MSLLIKRQIIRYNEEAAKFDLSHTTSLKFSYKRCCIPKVTWYANGVIHRDGDEPAMSSDAGFEHRWYKHGKLHREGDEPAIVEQMACTIYAWYKHGKLHRDDDQPAYMDHDDCLYKWYQNGKLHRDDGPAVVNQYPQDDACIEEFWNNGALVKVIDHHLNDVKTYNKHGKLHSFNDEPADKRDQSSKWYKCGILHRDDDKPAVVNSDGTLEYYRYGKRYNP